MTLSDSYGTPALYRNLIHKSDPGHDEDIRGDLAAMSRYLEYKLKDFFNKDDELTVRYFDAPSKTMPNAWSSGSYAEAENPYRYLRGEPYIYIDSIASITGLVIAVDDNRDLSYSTILASNQYLLHPRNALVGPEPRPYQYLARPTGSNWVPGANLKITAIWGWPAVPQPIIRACIHLTAILRIESPRATNSIDQMDNAVGASKECQDILHNMLKPYKRQVGFGNS